MVPPPAIVLMKGSTTVIAKAVATAASTALPPPARMAAPTSAPTGCSATTRPWRARAVCFVTRRRDRITPLLYSDRLDIFTTWSPPLRVLSAFLRGAHGPLVVELLAFPYDMNYLLVDRRENRRGRPSLQEILRTLDAEITLLNDHLGGLPRAV